jgi:hypothetical protein
MRLAFATATGLVFAALALALGSQNRTHGAPSK